MKPRYIQVELGDGDTIASLIQDRKELGVWLKDGSLQEGDIFYEVKAKYKVVKWKDESLCYTEEKL